jgi:small-conductance mechanosensitive channel
MTIEDFILGLRLKNFIVGLFLIGFGFLLGFVLSRVTIRFTTPFSGTARGKSLGRVVQWLTVVSFALIGGLVLFGASEALVAVVIAALTFAFTFGSQNVIQNFVAGLLIALDGRLQIGQWVVIGDQPLQSGPAEVLDISLQMVKIRESGGNVYFVPNSYIVMHKLLNISESGYLEVQVQMTLPYQEDYERVKQVLVEVAKDNPHVFPHAKRSLERMVTLPVEIKNMNTNVTVELPPEQMFPNVRMLKATHDGVDYLISMWTPFPAMRNEIVSDYLQRSIESLRVANIKLNNNLPFPAPKTKTECEHQ